MTNTTTRGIAHKLVLWLIIGVLFLPFLAAANLVVCPRLVLSPASAALDARALEDAANV